MSTSSAAFAQQVLIYPTKGRISYTQQPDPNSENCKLTLSQAQPAEILERRDGLIFVRFASGQVRGCSWLERKRSEGWIPEDQITYAFANEAQDEPPRRSSFPGPAELPPSNPAPAATLARSEQHLPKPDPPCPQTDQKQIPLIQSRLAQSNVTDINSLLPHLKAQEAGMRTLEDVEKYLRCYPHSAQGAENYQSYRPVIDEVVSLFKSDLGFGELTIQPTAYKCLLRRESGFDPVNKSNTGAVGLGQHTDINIKHINSRLKIKGSWESQLWERFFEKMKTHPQGQKLLAQCPQTRNGQKPQFATKEDAKCPLQSMAASAIYNLQVQQALRRSSKTKNIRWEDDLTYQTAIGATYNLGDGLAAKAVDDLSLGGWVQSIQQKSRNPSKRQEVNDHIEALRNCMQKDNWGPPTRGGRPQCPEMKDQISSPISKRKSEAPKPLPAGPASGKKR